MSILELVHDPEEGSFVCPECGSRNHVRDDGCGELVCRSCGVVVSETELDRGPDWIAYTPEERESLPRAGFLTLMSHDRGLSTTFRPKEMSGGLEQRWRMLRLKKWDHRCKMDGSENRNLARALDRLKNLGDRLKLPRYVLKTASTIYRQALQVDLIRGRSIRRNAAACLYMACLQCHVTRSLDEIAREARIRVKALTRDYRLLFWGLDADVPNANSKTRGLISRVVGELGIHGDAERLAALVLKEAEDNMLTAGMHPAGLAAACLYISTRITGERVTQEELSHEAEITEVTIRNRYKGLMEELDITIPL